jgi:hypothetical protein
LSVCLDSWAVLAWLDGEEPAHERIEQLLSDRPLMSWVNAVEVYYRVEHDHGRSARDVRTAGLSASALARFGRPGGVALALGCRHLANRQRAILELSLDILQFRDATLGRAICLSSHTSRLARHPPPTGVIQQSAHRSIEIERGPDRVAECRLLTVE